MAICRECEKEARSDRISFWGPFCSDECFDAFQEKRKARHASLRVEPLLSAPEELTVPDFETFALKVAVYAVLNLNEVQGVPEGMRVPEVLARRVKELLVQEFPAEYVNIWSEGSGWSRKELFSFRKPIPRKLLFDAMRRAGFAWNVQWLA